VSELPCAGQDASKFRVPRVSAALRVMGDTLDPTEITRIIGVEPDFSARKGDQRSRRTGVVTQRTGIWSRQSRPDASDEWDLDGTIMALLADISIPLDTWRALRDRYTTDVFCGLFMGRDIQGAALRPQTLQQLAERGLTLDLDVYGPPPGDEET
jgi:hypothetical protein